MWPEGCSLPTPGIMYNGLVIVFNNKGNLMRALQTLGIKSCKTKTLWLMHIENCMSQTLNIKYVLEYLSKLL